MRYLWYFFLFWFKFNLSLNLTIVFLRHKKFLEQREQSRRLDFKFKLLLHLRKPSLINFP